MSAEWKVLHQVVVAVGDVCVATLLEMGVVPDITIIDGIMAVS